MQHQNVQRNFGVADLLLAMHPPRLMHINQYFKTYAQTVAGYQFTVCRFDMQPWFTDLRSTVLFAAKLKAHGQMAIIGNRKITRIRFIELYDIEINVSFFNRYLEKARELNHLNLFDKFIR